jgi:hypothetical protein
MMHILSGKSTASHALHNAEGWGNERNLADLWVEHSKLKTAVTFDSSQLDRKSWGYIADFDYGSLKRPRLGLINSHLGTKCIRIAVDDITNRLKFYENVYPLLHIDKTNGFADVTWGILRIAHAINSECRLYRFAE